MSKKTDNKKGKTKEVKVVETKYTHDEILASASSLGERVEIIAGALRLSGKDELTRKELDDAIRKFKTRKV